MTAPAPAPATIESLRAYIALKERVLRGGNALSPGERRKLAEARALLRRYTKGTPR